MTMTHDYATTGVCDQVDLDYEWLFETHIYGGNAIDLEYEDYIREHGGEPPEDEEYLGSGEGRILFGDWTLDPADNLFGPDVNGENGFAAIYNRDVATIQVIWSRWYQNSLPASPCYPGQCCLLTDGMRKAYSLPQEAFDHRALAEWGGVIRERTNYL